MARFRAYAGDTRNFTSDLDAGDRLEVVTGPGRRSIETGASRDTVYVADFSPTAGPNRLDPAIDIDLLLVAAQVNLNLSTGPGHDEVIAPAVITDDAVTLSRGTLDLDLGPGRDRFAGIDGKADVDGGPGRDTLFGGPGLDTVAGGRGADRLAGDNLFGGRGRDFLEVPAERDRVDPILSPGRGPDTTFVFDQAGRRDLTTFLDFELDQDAVAVQFPFQNARGYLPVRRLDVEAAVRDAGGRSADQSSGGQEFGRLVLTATPRRDPDARERHVLEIPGLSRDTFVGLLSPEEILERIEGTGRLWGRTIEDNLADLADSAVWLVFNQAPRAERDLFEAEAGGRAVLRPLDNDSDPDGDDLSLERVWLPGEREEAAVRGEGWSEVDGVQFRIRGDRVVVKPGENVEGRLKFRYEISDGREGEAIGGGSIEGTDRGRMIVAVERDVPPEPVGGRFAVDENAPAPLDVLADNPEGLVPEEVEVGHLDSEGTFVAGFTRKGLPISLDKQDRVLVDTSVPRADRLGEGDILRDRFVERIVDETGTVGTARNRLLVEGANDAPFAEDDAATTFAGESVAIPVLDNDGDPDRGDGAALEIAEIRGIAVGAAPADGGSYVTVSDGEIVFVPGAAFEDLAEGETATEAFRYRVADPSGAESDFARVVVTVVGENAAPVAADDAFAVAADATRTGNVLAGDGGGPDADADGDALKVTAVDGAAENVGLARTLASGVVVSIGANGAIAIDPTGSAAALALRPADDPIVETLDYLVSDGRGGSDTATVTVTVTGVEDPPEPADDLLAAVAGAPLLADLFADNGDGPDADPDTGDTFSVVAVDGAAENVGAPLLLGSGATVTVAADGAAVVDTAEAAAIEALPEGGTLTDTFAYTVADAAGLTGTANVTLTVTGVNDAPLAVDDAFLGDEDTPILGNVLLDNGLGADTDPDLDDVLSVAAVNGDAAAVGEAVTLESGLLVEIAANGTISIDPTASAAAQALRLEGPPLVDTVTYTLADAAGATDVATVTITIAGREDAPIAADDLFVVEGADFLTGSVLADNGAGPDQDPDAEDTLSVVAVDGLAGNVGESLFTPDGVLYSIGADGTISIDASETGATALDEGDPPWLSTATYTLSDAAGATDTATVTIRVDGVNDPPIAVDDTAFADSFGTTVFSSPDANLIGNDSDPDTADADALRIVAVDGTGQDGTSPGGVAFFEIVTALGATVTVFEDGVWSYDAPGLSTGFTDEFSYTLSDGDATDVATVTVFDELGIV